MIGNKLRKLKEVKVTNRIAKTVNGMYNGGKYARPKITLEFRIIPILKLIKSEGMIIKVDSKKRILFIALFLEPKALIIKKSLAFSIIPLF